MLEPKVGIDISRIGKKYTYLRDHYFGPDFGRLSHRKCSRAYRLDKMDILCLNTLATWRPRNILSLKILNLYILAMPLFLRFCAVSKVYF